MIQSGNFHERTVKSQRLLGFCLALSLALTLTACKHSKKNDRSALDPATTSSLSPGQGSFKDTMALAKRWQKDPQNMAIGMDYARNLEAIGQRDQQLQVLGTLVRGHPENNELAGFYGKKLINAGQAQEAIPVLQRAAASSRDWSISSALGSAYDQQGHYEQARQAYRQALALQPNEPSILNNLAMSHTSEGNLKQAETILHQAIALPESRNTPQIRQNLALVTGLQGRFSEARKIAAQDLPPDQIEANMAYLEKMLSKGNVWKQLSADNTR